MLHKVSREYILNTYPACLKFEYDSLKNAANTEKRGISFEEAQKIWNDPDYIKVPAKKRGEKRYLVLGMVENRCLAAIATDRGSAVRIISARRASETEAKRYGKYNR